MRVVTHWLRVALPAALLFGAGIARPALAQQRVGVDSAVNPAATGTALGGSPQRLVLGQNVLFNERIATSAQGQTQILFVDESTLSVGPNANMVIDQFVYNPNAGTGKMVASLARGVFRFVGGKLSKEAGAVTMRTPAATIGIRGGVMLVRVAPGCTDGGSGPSSSGCAALQVIFVYGKSVTVTGLDGVSQTLTRPGFAITVSQPGAAPSHPAPAPLGATATLLDQLDGRPGANGGAPEIPTEVTVANSGIASEVSANIAASIVAASYTQPPSPPPNNTGTAVQLSQANNQNVSVPGATVTPVGGGPSFTIAQFPQLKPSVPIVPPVKPVIPPSPPSPPRPPAPPVPPLNIAALAGRYYASNNHGTLVGFSGPGTAYQSGAVVDGTFIASGAFGAISFPLAEGAATLPISGAGTSSPLGPVTGSTYLAPDGSFFFADLAPVSQPGRREFIYGGKPVSASFTSANGPRVLAFTVVPDAALESAIPFIRQQTGGSLPSPSVSPLILATPAGSVFSTDTGQTKALQASLAISGTGAKQSSAIVVLVGDVIGSPPTLEGVVHASYLATAESQPIAINTYVVTPADGNGDSFYGGSTISGFVLSPGAGSASAVETNTLNQTTSAKYQFAQPVVATAPPAAAIAAPTAENLTGWFGGIMTKEPNGGNGSPISYLLTGRIAIKTNPSDLQMTATLTGGDPDTSQKSGIAPTNGMVLQFGTTVGPDSRQAYINNNLFAVEESPTSRSTVNGVSVPANLQSPNTNPNLYLVTATAAEPTTLLPNGLCSACQYLQWGYWGGEIDTPAAGDQPARVDVGHINSWVAGIPTAVADISSLKAANFTGSYTGNLFGTVINNGAQYLASGALTAIYNFGTGHGSFSVANYDGLSFTANGNLALSGSNYTFGLNSPGLAGSVSGSFYGPMAAETGGNFAFAKTVGSPYFTSGIFAAKR
jgi:trimeric autotransporter adhesin